MKRAALMVVLLSSLCGCVAYKRAYVAVHDSIDEVLSESAVTNAATGK